MDGKWHIGVRIEDAPTTEATRKGFTGRIEETAPGCQCRHQLTHREQMAINKIPPDLPSVTVI